MLTKHELTGWYELVSKLKDDNIIISNLALKISFKVDKVLVDY